MSDILSQFGKPKYGSGTGTQTFRLKEGTTSEFRIIPPMKSLAETGEWAVYGGTHFGYKGVNPKDASKPVYRTFRCIQEKDWKTNTIVQACPECDLIEARKKERDRAKAKLEGDGKSEADVKEILKPANDWLSDHNCDRKWRMNVKNAQGEMGRLYISHRTKKKLDAKLAGLLTDEGIDALEYNQGAWFRFTRTGKGVDTNDEVEVATETVIGTNGQRLKAIKPGPLTEAELMTALKDCEDLSKVDRELSFEVISMLTKCNGDPEEVDGILAMGQKDKPAPVKTAPAPVAKAAAPKMVPAQVPVPADDAAAQIAALQAQIAALSAVKTTPTTPTPVESGPVVPQAVAAPAADAPVPGGVDRFEFLNKFRP